MKSNFEFLTKRKSMQALYTSVKDIEELYTLGKFNSEFETICRIIENIVRKALDLEYVKVSEHDTLNDCLLKLKQKKLVDKSTLKILYQLKNMGNTAVHTWYEFSNSEAVDGLARLRSTLVWFIDKYTDGLQDIRDFLKPP